MGRQNQPPASPYPPENIPRRNTPGSIPLPQAIKPLTKTQVGHLGPEGQKIMKKHRDMQVIAYSILSREGGMGQEERVGLGQQTFIPL